MKKLLVITAILALSSSVFAQTRWYSFNEGYALAKKTGRPVIVDFYADWCTWCHKMEKDTFGNPEISKLINARFVAIRLDTEGKQRVSFEGKSYSPNEFSGLFNVTGLPTILFLDRAGKPIGTQPGYTGPNEFLPILKFIDSECYKKTSFSDFRKKGDKCN